MHTEWGDNDAMLQVNQPEEEEKEKILDGKENATLDRKQVISF